MTCGYCGQKYDGRQRECPNCKEEDALAEQEEQNKKLPASAPSPSSGLLKQKPWP